MSTFAGILAAVAGTVGSVPLLAWLVAAAVGLPLLTAAWAWRRVFRAGHLHGPTAAQIAAMPVVAVSGRRYTIEAIEADLDAREARFQQRLADELLPYIDALDDIEARFRDQLWGFA